MSRQIYFLLAVFSILSVSASGQCAKPDLKPVWDIAKQQFRCVDLSTTSRASSEESVLPIGDKTLCSAARENLIKVCPSPDEGKACKNKAKSIFNACYKDSKAEEGSRARSSSSTGLASKTDPSVCVQIFNQQQQACNARKTPPPAPGQPYVPDTCLQDAIAAQNKCLTK